MSIHQVREHWISVMWVLGIQLWPSGKAVTTCNHQVIFPDPKINLFIFIYETGSP